MCHMWRRIHVCHTMQLSVSSIYLSIYLPPTYVPIYLYDDVMHAQKRPTIVSKETYYLSIYMMMLCMRKRDLL